MDYSGESESEADFFQGDSDEEEQQIREDEPLRRKKWDAAEIKPPDVDSGSEAAKTWVKRFEKLMLILAYILTFAIVLVCAVASKGVTLFIISQISPKDRKLAFCNNCDTARYISDCTKNYEIDRSRPIQRGTIPFDDYEKKQLDILETEQIAWIWVLIFAYCTPEVFAFIRSARSCFFKTPTRPKFLDFLFVFVMETFHVAGLAILAFVALPAFDSARAAVFSNCLAFIPAIFLFVSRFGMKKDKLKWVKIGIDVLAIAAQLSGIFIVPILYWSNGTSVTPTEWAMPVGLLMTSFGWWECFIVEEKNEESSLALVKAVSGIRHRMIDGSRYFTYVIISIWKILVFMAMAWGLTFYTGILLEPYTLFTKFKTSFKSHGFNVTEISDVIFGDTSHTGDSVEVRYVGTLFTEDLSPVWVFLVQIGTSHLTYIFSKFACKVQIQGFSYAFPLSFVVPITVALTLSFCGIKAKDTCSFDGFIPGYLFYECPAIGDFFQYIWTEQVWLWAVWFLSQLWIARHIWFPESPRLASTEQIFGTPMYCSLFVDQSVVLNRRRDGPVGEMTIEELEDEKRDEELAAFYIQNDAGKGSGSGNGDEIGSNVKHVHGSDRITRIYGCATMWHENKDEMIEMLKSIYRIDKDYSDRRLSQKYLGVVDRDFYEWETHIFFDDAFELGDNDEEQQVVNSFVKLLVKLMDEAGSFVHCQNIRVKPPKKIPTPYGGRLIWTLPGKTKIVCHLKDKAKIRHKKRWSQCMYMYYLLGFKLMELPISDERKQVKAENTYLLALDGDIDFQAESITRLVDLMKKNKDLGAACGRIHPTGSGFMVWYQKFEYAIGHWLQKATEHVMGCVLCSPGCFSLFRGSALMDSNVMAKYTTKSERPLDYVQYDQGEDRWLCTLLLQQGWRVEYSAASDAFTACPEGFNEFFNQRRRWMPSTIANIFDLLSDAKNVVKVNKDISTLYIAYQIMMMVGTVLGPGTIFLMLVGAFSVAFRISNWESFVYNLIPIIGFMLICFVMDGKIQLFVAQVLSAIYGLIMMAVLVGILLQMTQDGPLAPSSLSIFLVGGSFILAACLHPQEFWCLPHGIIYYITIPAMYLLLVIYSIFNLNNVSWGTREVTAKKSKKELDEERQREEEAAKTAKKNNKSKKDGILGFLMAQSDRKAEKGGFEFSLANLFKCMLFTHDDPAGDANIKLDKIAIELDSIGKKLNRLETGSSGGQPGSLFRRKSSYGHRSRSIGGSGGNLLDARRSSSVESARMMGEPGFNEVNDVMYPNESSSEEEEETVNRNQRDDNINPFWIEDRELRNGPIDFLPGSEQQFWNDVIEKYLEPEPFKTKEVVAKQKKTAEDLKTLRNQMVFTFFMLNAVFVTAIYLLQQNKDSIFIRWPLGAKSNVTFIQSTDSPIVEVSYGYLQLEPIGLVFVVFFACVLGIQVVGMLFHRWGTISHIIATTKLAWCERTTKDETPQGTIDKNARSIVKAIQEEPTSKKNKNRLTSRVDGRRMTIMANVAARQKKADFTNLERDFKKKFQSLRVEDLEKSDNPALRRVAARRGTMKAFEERRDTFIGAERRRSTIRRMSSVQSNGLTTEGMLNSGFENDSALYEDNYSSGMGSRTSHNSQFEYVDPEATTSF